MKQLIISLFLFLIVQIAFSQNQEAEKAETFPLTTNNKLEKNYTIDPYQFKPFPVDKEDGIYEVLNTSTEYVYIDVVLVAKPVLSKSDIEDAKADIDQYIQRPVINIKLTEAGALKFAEATEKNIGKPLAIVIDKKVISMPIVQEKIPSGKIQISGDFTVEETKELADKLMKK